MHGIQIRSLCVTYLLLHAAALHPVRLVADTLLRQKALTTLLCALAVFLTVLSSVSIVQAANYYVDNAVSSSGNGTSWASAWKSFSHIAWSSIRPGDTIYLSGGKQSKTYTETLKVGASGTSASPITITRGTDPGHNGTVTIDGQLRRQSGVDIEGDNYVTVRRLNVKHHIGEQGQIRVFNCASVHIENNDLYVTGHGGVFIQNCANTVIRSNTITTPTHSTAQTDGIYSQRNVGGNIYEYNTIVISNSEQNGHDDCIQMYQDASTVIRGNHCEQNNTKTYNAQGFWMTDNTGTIEVYNNVLYGPSTRNTLIGLSNAHSGNARLVAYNNTLVGSAWGSIWIQNASNSLIKNNVVQSTASAAILVRITGSTLPAAHVNNNLYYAPNSSQPFWNETSNTRYAWTAWRALGYDASSKNAPTKLLNTESKDFHLQPTSPAVDAGTSLSQVITDKDGVTRPQGSGYDIGAYESTGFATPGPTPPVRSKAKPSGRRPTGTASTHLTISPSPSALRLLPATPIHSQPFLYQ